MSPRLGLAIVACVLACTTLAETSAAFTIGFDGLVSGATAYTEGGYTLSAVDDVLFVRDVLGDPAVESGNPLGTPDSMALDRLDGGPFELLSFQGAAVFFGDVVELVLQGYEDPLAAPIVSESFAVTETLTTFFPTGFSGVRWVTFTLPVDNANFWMDDIAVPEPGTALLTLLGLVATGLACRRERGRESDSA